MVPPVTVKYDWRPGTDGHASGADENGLTGCNPLTEAAGPRAKDPLAQCQVALRLSSRRTQVHGLRKAASENGRPNMRDARFGDLNPTTKKGRTEVGRRVNSGSIPRHEGSTPEGARSKNPPHADVVQRQNTGFPSRRRGFDSRHPLPWYLPTLNQMGTVVPNLHLLA